MRTAIGESPTEDVVIEYVSTGDYDEAVHLIDTYEIDLVLLDGESQPAGGLGIARQLRDEIDDVPTIAVVLARPADRWLGAWSRADATLMHPLDPIRTAETVVDLLRQRRAVQTAESSHGTGATGRGAA
ncbi:hypothetical protein [Natronoglycomyces albus]